MGFVSGGSETLPPRRRSSSACFQSRVGRGYSSRNLWQKRTTFDDDHLFVDLVFYNILLKCYLLIDLKMGKLTHQDVGQMDSYVRIFDEHDRAPGDGPTIGLILCAEENHTIARYSVLAEHRQLFAAKYLTCLRPKRSCGASSNGTGASLKPAWRRRAILIVDRARVLAIRRVAHVARDWVIDVIVDR